MERVILPKDFATEMGWMNDLGLWKQLAYQGWLAMVLLTEFVFEWCTIIYLEVSFDIYFLDWQWMGMNKE